MGLGQADSMGNKKTFADDVLKIEICGPDQEHFSVVDVPGIFKKTTPGVTSKTDVTLVRNMVTTYMRNPRSVILAVIPANVDIATQEILEVRILLRYLFPTKGQGLSRKTYCRSKLPFYSREMFYNSNSWLEKVMLTPNPE